MVRPFKRLDYLLFSVLFAVCFSSCVTTRHSSYFQTLSKRDTTLTGFVSDNYESVIVAGDKLGIAVSSLNPLEDAIFNSSAVAAAPSASATTGAGSPASSSPGGYTVDPDGSILFHYLGKVQVAGMTRRLLANDLENRLTPFLKDPVVQVNFLNHKVTVLGEVSHPGIIQMPDNNLSLIDALVISGDVTVTGRRDDVTIIRDSTDKRIVKHINLQDNSIFSSRWYYLRPNDIVMVNTNFEKADKDIRRQRLQSTISLGVSFISLLLIILDRVVK